MADILRIDWSHDEARARLDKLRGSLSMDVGQVTATSQQKTAAVFGEPLSPISVVRLIMDEVRVRGDEAVAKYSLKLDRFECPRDGFRMDPARFADAWERCDDELKQALQLAKTNIETFQKHLLRGESGVFKRDGVTMECVSRPIRRVGVYIPGGEAAYPSAVLMDVIPAQVAGCSEIAVATPPGHTNDTVLAAFHLLGLREVYQVGGVQAIAMFAYGTETVPGVDMIVGAGNLFVNLAKREAFGTVKIDMLAGPSEVFIIADETADAAYVAADMLSQAEHYPGAAMAACDSDELLEAVARELESQVSQLTREKMCRESLAHYGCLIKVDGMDSAVEVANLVAPEHLEIMTAEPRSLAARIVNAGTVFLGDATPEPVGDYTAGSSHTLPTGGTARFANGLSALEFMKRITFIEYDRAALAGEVPHLTKIARQEGLEAHARAAEKRFED
jgi:histidinol dehydrogenase